MTKILDAGIWPVIEDDDGSGKRGTPSNASDTAPVTAGTWFSDMELALDDLFHSTTNTALKPKDITDEVVAASTGGAASDALALAARENVHSRQDGTVIVPDIFGTQINFQELIGQRNLLANDTFLIWASGPQWWNWSGNDIPAVETTTVRLGPNSASLAADGSENNFLYQDIVDAGVMADFNEQLDGVKIGFGAWVYAGAASNCRLEFDDGADTTELAWHDGDSAWAWFSGVHTISKSASRLRFLMQLRNATDTAYLSGTTAIFSGLAPTGWIPSPKSYRSVKWSFDGTMRTGDTQRIWQADRPGIIKSVQAYAGVAPGAGNNLTIDVVRNSGTWDTIFDAAGVNILATTANAGSYQTFNSTYHRRCFAAYLSGVSNNLAELALDVDAVGATADCDIYVRYLTYERVLEDFYGYDDAPAGDEP